MKRYLSPIRIFLSIICTLSLMGCGGRHVSDRSESSGKSEYTPELCYALETYYPEHGELSSGRIWVKSQTEGNYNEAPKSLFAYLNEHGDVVGKWFYWDDWSPHDFSNGLVHIAERNKFPFIPDSITYRIYDINMDLVQQVTVRWHNPAVGSKYVLITDANSDGDIFAVEWGSQEDHLLCINANEVITLNTSYTLYYADLSELAQCRRVIVDSKTYYVVYLGQLSGDGAASCAEVFDSRGDLILNVSDAIGYDIYQISIRDKNILEVTFRGDDRNRYTVHTDFQGEFLDSPQRRTILLLP